MVCSLVPNRLDNNTLCFAGTRQHSILGLPWDLSYQDDFNSIPPCSTLEFVFKKWEFEPIAHMAINFPTFRKSFFSNSLRKSGDLPIKIETDNFVSETQIFEEAAWREKKEIFAQWRFKWNVSIPKFLRVLPFSKTAKSPNLYTATPNIHQRPICVKPLMTFPHPHNH